jgi:hypothetical protein
MMVSQPVLKKAFILIQIAANQHKKILNWLTTINFFQRQADILSIRHPGTGQWLLEDPQFKAWQSGAGKILWCRGMRMSSNSTCSTCYSRPKNSGRRKNRSHVCARNLGSFD